MAARSRAQRDLLQLARTWVPRHIRVRGGKRQDVEAHWRRFKATRRPSRSDWLRSLGATPTPRSEWVKAVRESQRWGLEQAVQDARFKDLTPEQMKVKADEHVRGMVRGTKVAIRVDSEDIGRIVRDRRVRNQWEIPTGEGGTRSEGATLRHELEGEWFGIPEDTPDVERPIYGFLARDPKATKFQLGGTQAGVGIYGDAVIVLKPEARRRTTFTVGDSANQNTAAVDPDIQAFPTIPRTTPQPVLSPSSDAWPWGDETAYWEDENYNQHAFVPQDVASADQILRAGSFMEAQVHGGVRLEDVEEVVFTVDNSRTHYAAHDKRVREMLDRAGVKWRNDFNVRMRSTTEKERAQERLVSGRQAHTAVPDETFAPTREGLRELLSDEPPRAMPARKRIRRQLAEERVSFDLKGIRPEYAREIEDTVNVLMDRYPEAGWQNEFGDKARLSIRSWDMSGYGAHGVAQAPSETVEGTAQIRVNKRFAARKGAVEDQLFEADTSSVRMEDVIRHEFGHVLDHSLKRRRQKSKVDAVLKKHFGSLDSAKAREKMRDVGLPYAARTGRNELVAELFSWYEARKQGLPYSRPPAAATELGRLFEKEFGPKQSKPRAMPGYFTPKRVPFGGYPPDWRARITQSDVDAALEKVLAEPKMAALLQAVRAARPEFEPIRVHATKQDWADTLSDMGILLGEPRALYRYPVVHVSPSPVAGWRASDHSAKPGDALATHVNLPPTLRHEIGHYVHGAARAGTFNGAPKGWGLWSTLGVAHSSPTTYAEYNAGEGFAETFAIVMHPDFDPKDWEGEQGWDMIRWMMAFLAEKGVFVGEQTPLATVIAGEVIRLQGTTFQVLLDQAVEQRQALSELLQSFVADIEETWLRAAQEAGSYVALVKSNNTLLSLEEVIEAREDVRQALELPFREAQARAEEAVRSAWAAAEDLGFQHGDADLQTAGVGPGTHSPTDTALLDRVLGDVRKNADEAGGRLIARFQKTPESQWADAAEREGRILDARARMSVEAAGGTAHSQAMAQTYTQAGLRLVWVTSFSPATCQTCAQLHGTVRAPGVPFPILGLKGIHALGYPPRHPNCRCRLVPWKGSFGDEGGATPATMTAFAQKWMAQHRRVS